MTRAYIEECSLVGVRSGGDPLETCCEADGLCDGHDWNRLHGQASDCIAR